MCPVSNFNTRDMNNHTIIKIVKVTAIAVAAAVLLLLVVQWWLGHAVRKALGSDAGPLKELPYKVDAGRVGVNLLDRSVSVRNIRIVPDTARGGGEHTFVVSMSSGRIKLGGIELGKIIRGEEFSLNSIALLSPELTIDIYGGKGEKEHPADTAAKSHQKHFSVGTIAVRNGDILIRRHEGDLISSYRFKGVGLEVTALTNETAHGQIPISADGATLGVDTFILANPDQSNILTVSNIRFDSRSGVFSLDSLALAPQFGMEEFARRNFSHSDWTKVATGAVTASGIDTERFLSDGVLRIDSVGLASASLESYKDRNVVQAPRVKRMLHESVQRLPIPIYIRTAHIGHADAAYRELARGGINIGVVEFAGLTGNFDGLTNIHSDSEPFYTLRAHGLVYGNGKLSATFYLPKDARTNRFEVEGHLSDMDATLVNRMVTPLENAAVRSGRIDDMAFHITGTEMESNVQMTMLYHNLDVALLKYEDHHLHERKLITWLANKVVRPDNPHNGVTHTGHGTTERDFQRSQYNYLWRSLLPGVKGCVGL